MKYILNPDKDVEEVVNAIFDNHFIITRKVVYLMICKLIVKKNSELIKPIVNGNTDIQHKDTF